MRRFSGVESCPCLLGGLVASLLSLKEVTLGPLMDLRSPQSLQKREFGGGGRDGQEVRRVSPSPVSKIHLLLPEQVSVGGGAEL